MTDLHQKLQSSVLRSDDFDVLDVIPIPMHGDRMVRLRTFEEALEDFDRQDTGSGSPVMGYFIQIKAKIPGAPTRTQTPQVTENPRAPTQSASDGIYLPDGKLNSSYLLETAETLFEAKDYNLARNIYKALLQSGGKNSLSHLGLARCFEAEGKLEEARINFEEAIAYHPHPEAYKSLTALLIRQKKDQEAAETIERALHHRQLEDSLKYELHKTAGNCWSRIGNIRESERHYKRALEIRPDADEIRANLGALFLAHNRIEEAERHFQDAIASNPKNAQALSGLGSCAVATGNSSVALNWFSRALQADLKNPTALYHLIKCAYATQDYKAAADIAENYAQIAPVNTHLLYCLAGLQFHLGRYGAARATCHKILQMDPEHAGAKEILQKIANQVEGLDSIGG